MPTPIPSALRRNLARILLAAITLLCAAGVAIGQASSAQYPRPGNDYVNDFAGVLSPADRDAIHAAFKRLEYQTGIEAVVVTVDTIGAYGTGDPNIESFAKNLFNTWGIGHRKTNDGVLFLIAVRDRKARIQLGRSYAHRFDARMKRILDDVVVPRFKAGELGHGIRLGSAAIVEEVTVPVSWLQFYKWHLALGGGALALTLSGIFLERRGRRGLVWLCFGGVFFLLFLLISKVVSGQSQDGFGGGSTGGDGDPGGGASAEW